MKPQHTFTEINDQLYLTHVVDGKCVNSIVACTLSLITGADAKLVQAMVVVTPVHVTGSAMIWFVLPDKIINETDPIVLSAPAEEKKSLLWRIAKSLLTSAGGVDMDEFIRAFNQEVMDYIEKGKPSIEQHYRRIPSPY